MAGPPVSRLTVPELRQLFNKHYLARILDGTLKTRPFDIQSPYHNPPGLHGYEPEPEGTLSGLIEIIDPSNNGRLAVAHRLLRPNGEYGASGLPDPKMVFVDGVIYLEKRKQGRAAEDLKTPSLFDRPSAEKT
jgi:hypothetical protein